MKRANLLRWPAIVLGLVCTGAGTSRESDANSQLPSGAAGQDAHAVPRSKQAAENPPPPTSPPAKAGPKYLDLRYDEDFSYLGAESGSYREDYFDPIKYIELADNWHLTLGGEFRMRLEAETNKAFGATEPAQDTFLLHRYFLHADLHYRDLFRVFVQGVTAFDEERNLAKRAIDENQWDVHQAFFDARILGGSVPLTFRLGRQELSYGNQRLISPLDWANVRRRFDAAKLIWKVNDWQLDAWFARPVIVDRVRADSWNEDFDFYGSYFTYTGWKNHGLDAYCFYTDKNSATVNVNGRRGEEHRYTLGSRFWGKQVGWDYETEVAGQWGKWAGDTIQAYSVALDGGYTLSESAWKPRVGAGFDWASGDDDPRDSQVQTFDQLFPLGHKYFGYIDLVGRQNITAINVNVSAWPVEKKVKTSAAYHVFRLSEDEDALYDAGGRALRRDRSGESGRRVGQELDLTVDWQPNVHSSVLFGYSHFWSGKFISDTGPREDADLFYVQYRFRF